jgi:hypothetical protein
LKAGALEEAEAQPGPVRVGSHERRVHEAGTRVVDKAPKVRLRQTGMKLWNVYHFFYAASIGELSVWATFVFNAPTNRVMSRCVDVE